jgi:hypothetical protein
LSFSGKAQDMIAIQTSGQSTIHGLFQRNTMQINSNTEGEATGWLIPSSSIVEVDAGILKNTFTLKNITGIFTTGMYITSGSLTNLGDFTENEFNISNAGTFGVGFLIENTSTFVNDGDFNKNQFILSDTDEGIVGLLATSSSNITLNGSFNENEFTLSDGGSEVFGFVIFESNFYNAGEFNNNFFNIDSSTDENYGIYLEESEFTNNGNFKNNEFIISNGTDNNIAFDATIGINLSISGMIADNRIVITNGMSGTNNYGFYWNVSSGNTMTFSQIITNNLVTINGDAAGNYGLV